MTDRLALPRRYRDQLEALLREHVPGVEVWAYGSRVNGESHDGSDLDLVLRCPALEPLDGGFYDLLEAIEKSNIPILVQAHDWAMLPESFQREIELDYVVVQEGVGKQTTAGEWCEVTLGEVLTLQRGFDLPTTQRKPGSYPVIASTGPVGTHGEAMVRGPGVVIGRSGSLGGGQFVEHDFWPLNTTLWVKDFKGNDPRFCYYLLKSIDLAQFNVGSGVPTLNRNHIHPFPVALPPLHEQRAIAHVLGTLDDKIELNRRMNETLEGMARALFKSWFVDFEPVRAKMEGRWRRGESLPGLPAEHYDLFPDRTVGSELGEVPEGWGVKTLGEVATLNPESWSRTNTPADVEYVDLANTKWGVIESTQSFLWKDAPSRAKRVLRPGDTIVGTVRPGNGSYSLIGHDGLTGSTGFAVLRPLHPRFRDLVYLAATTVDNIEWLAHRADGAAYPAVRPQVVSKTEVVIPIAGSDVLDCFSMTVGPILAKIESTKTESRSLAAHRDALLSGLVSGEVGVGDATQDTSGRV